MHFQSYFLLFAYLYFQLYFLQLPLFQNRYDVCLRFRATLPFLSGFYAIAHAPTRFCPGTSQCMSDPARLTWLTPFVKTSQLDKWANPFSTRRDFIVDQISIIAELCWKIDFPLNEPLPSQPATYNEAVN